MAIQRVIEVNGAKALETLSGANGSGLPLGAYISYEGEVPNGYLECDGSTFDASSYPALASLLGGNTLPEVFDHDEEADFTTIQLDSTSNPVTMEFDGILLVSVMDGSGATAYLHLERDGTSNDFLLCNDATDRGGTTVSIPVKKGDLVSLVTGGLGIGAFTARICYYKKHLAIKATVGFQTNEDAEARIFNYIDDWHILYNGTVSNYSPIVPTSWHEIRVTVYRNSTTMDGQALMTKALFDEGYTDIGASIEPTNYWFHYKADTGAINYGSAYGTGTIFVVEYR